VIAVFGQRNAGIATSAPVPSRGLVVGVYTSSQIEKFGDALPVGVIQVPRKKLPKAATSRRFHRRPQASFHPFTRNFFPSLINRLRRHRTCGQGC